MSLEHSFITSERVRLNPKHNTYGSDEVTLWLDSNSSSESSGKMRRWHPHFQPSGRAIAAATLKSLIRIKLVPTQCLQDKLTIAPIWIIGPSNPTGRLLSTVSNVENILHISVLKLSIFRTSKKFESTAKTLKDKVKFLPHHTSIKDSNELR